MKILYEEELVEEEFFLGWYDLNTPKDDSIAFGVSTVETLEQLRLNAAPFLLWLREAEEED